MRKGRPKWTRKLSRPALERIQQAVAGGEDSRAVFDWFNVSQYGITPRTFRQWCDVYRRDWTARQETPGGATEGTDAATLLDSLLSSMQVALDAGRLPEEKFGEAIHAAARARELEFRHNADQRAQKLFESKVEKLKPAVREAVKSGGGSEGDSKGIRGVLEAVASGAMVIEDAVSAIDGLLWTEIDKYMKGAA